MKLLKIVTAMAAFCSMAGTLAMESPQGSNQRKKINSNYRAQSNQRKAPMRDDGQEFKCIKFLLHVNATTFSTALQTLKRHLKAYDQLHEDIQNFSTLDELLFTIGQNPKCLLDPSANEQLLFEFKGALYDLFKTAHNRCQESQNGDLNLCSEEAISMLWNKVDRAIINSQAVLQRYSDSLTEKVFNAYKPVSDTFQVYGMQLNYLETLLLKQELAHKQLEFRNDRSQRLTEKQTEIKNSKVKLQKLKQEHGILAMQSAWNDFANATESLLNSRSWNEFNLGRLDVTLLLDVISKFEENVATKKLIEILYTKFSQADRKNLYDAFVKGLQSYVMFAYSGITENKIKAKGYLWELAVSGFLFDTYKNDLINVGNEVFHSKDSMISCFIDHELRESYIECKNTSCLGQNYWGKENEITKLQTQLLKELSVAESNGKSLVLISKLDIRATMKEWFEKHSILLVYPGNKKNSPLGDASALYELTSEIS